MAVKDLYQTNIEEWIDPEYGYKIIKPFSEKRNRSLYFTSNPFLENNQYLICCLERNGRDNLYKLNLKSGVYQQLTDEDNLFTTISYVDKDETFIYCRTVKQIFRVNLNTCEKEVFLDFTNSDKEFLPSIAITCDSKFLITGYPDVLKVPNADGQIQTINMTKIIKIDVKTKEIKEILHVSYRIDHIQCSPINPNWFIYCCWGYYPSHHRIWGSDIDGKRGGPLGDEQQNEHRTHEYFLKDGRIAYHTTIYKGIKEMGKYAVDYRGFGIMNWDGKRDTVYRCPNGYKAGHSHISSNNEIIIADGVDKISLLFLNGASLKCEVKPIFSHMSSMSCNYVHPHPAVSQDGKYVCFATDFGKGEAETNIYLIELTNKE